MTGIVKVHVCCIVWFFENEMVHHKGLSITKLTNFLFFWALYVLFLLFISFALPPPLFRFIFHLLCFLILYLIYSFPFTFCLFCPAFIIFFCLFFLHPLSPRLLPPFLFSVLFIFPSSYPTICPFLIFHPLALRLHAFPPLSPYTSPLHPVVTPFIPRLLLPPICLLSLLFLPLHILSFLFVSLCFLLQSSFLFSLNTVPLKSVSRSV